MKAVYSIHERQRWTTTMVDVFIKGFFVLKTQRKSLIFCTN